MDFIFNNKVKEISLEGFMVEELEALARKDGRFMGNAMETLLDLKFDNLTKKDDNGVWDMDTPDKRTVEVRVIGRARQASFDSSTNAGKGRSGLHLEDTLKKIEQVSDWIFVDVLNFPLVSIYHVSKDRVVSYFANCEKQIRRVNFKKFKEDFYG